MKAIYTLVVLSILSLSFGETFITYGNLQRTDELVITNRNKKNYALYLDMSQFQDQDNVYIKITVYNGYFREKKMYYGYNSTMSEEVFLDFYQFYNSKKEGKYFGESCYYDYTYFYEIKKSKKSEDKYLFVSIPEFEGSHVEICISKDEADEISVGAIVGIVLSAAVLLAVAIFLIIYFVRKFKKDKIVPPMDEYAPPLDSDKPGFPSQTQS